MESYQKSAKIKNKHRIIQALNRKPLSFQELIEELGLSRGVVNKHLHALENEGTIKKEYVKGKLLNVLQRKKVNLVDYFLEDLATFSIPKDILDEGRTLLNDGTISFSGMMIGPLMHRVIEMNNRLVLTRNPKAWKPPLTPLMRGIERTHPKLQAILTKERDNTETLVEVNPFHFHILMVLYRFESTSKHALKDKPIILDAIMMNEETVKPGLDKSMKWWFEKVAPYLPIAGLLEILIGLVFNVNESQTEK